MSLTVIIPTLNAAACLPATLAALSGVDEVIVADGGSTDGTVAMATACGARIAETAAGRGAQLIAGAAVARSAWFLFLHADTVLAAGWRAEADEFIARPKNLGRAATFRFALDDGSPAARRLERLVAWRAKTLALPYGDQGLLIHHDFYRALGGFRAWPLMEDVDLVRRIGRRRLRFLRSVARTSAERWRRDGWLGRSLRNLVCLTLYLVGIPPRLLLRLYG